jgi:hypothetical protein
VSSYLGLTIRAGLVFPLILVAALAGGVGYIAGRGVYPGQDAPRVSTVLTNAAVPTATPTATSAPPAQAPSTRSSGSGGGSSDNCPAGCECRHPQGGIVIVCHGSGAVHVP